MPARAKLNQFNEDGRTANYPIIVKFLICTNFLVLEALICHRQRYMSSLTLNMLIFTTNKPRHISNANSQSQVWQY